MPSAGQVENYNRLHCSILIDRFTIDDLNTPLFVISLVFDEQLVAGMKQSFSAYRLVNFLRIATILALFVFLSLTLPFYRNKLETIISQPSPSFRSTCGDEADARGPNQSVIAFSLFGELTDVTLFSRYVLPLRALVANISRAYPGKNTRKISRVRDIMFQ